MAEPTVSARIEQAITTYIDACNDADAQGIAACFLPDAVHYFPGAPKWSGAAAISGNFSERVRQLGHFWTVDQLVIDAERCAGVLEWTRFDGKERILRGVDLFVFEPQSLLIREIGPYGAAPIQPDLARQELQDFDYAGRGYPMTRPA